MTVRVHGLRQFTQRLERAGLAIGDLKDVMHGVGSLVAEAAKPLTSPDSRTLANSIRSARAKNKAIVRAGGARAVYAGVQHFGWPRRNIAPKNYLYDALDSRRDEVLAKFYEGIKKAAES